MILESGCRNLSPKGQWKEIIKPRRYGERLVLQVGESLESKTRFLQRWVQCETVPSFQVSVAVAGGF